MKISELIKELEAIKAVQGDIDVRCWPYDGQAREYSPKLEVHFSAKDGPPVLEIDGI
ncbi:MAG: hypothetical protein AB2745_08620 [Candidatus Thiodiazotropha endolucinida]